MEKKSKYDRGWVMKAYRAIEIHTVGEKFILNFAFRILS